MTVGVLKNSNELIQAVFRGDFDDFMLLLDPIAANYQDEQKQSVLHAASHCGEARFAEVLLREGALVNVTDTRWLTALHRACASGASDVVRILLAHDADRNARDRNWRTPLHMAASSGNVECVRLLLTPSTWMTNLNASDRLGHTPLHHAVRFGHVDVVRLLLEKGASVNAFDKRDRRAMHWAAVYGQTEIIGLLSEFGAEVNCRDRDQFTPLHGAAALGFTTTVKRLIGLGAELQSTTARGNTPLHIACLNGHEAIVELLLEAIGNEAVASASSTTASFSSDLNEQDDSEDLKKEQDRIRSDAVIGAINRISDCDRMTPVHLAVSSTKGASCLRLLLEASVPRTECCLAPLSVLSVPGGVDGMHPLHLAALHGRSDRSDLLFEYGASVEARDRWGNTALHIAANRGHELFVHRLLRAGCRWDLRGHEGFTPMHYAAMSGFQTCLLRLIGEAVFNVLESENDQNPFVNEPDVPHSPDHLNVADIIRSDNSAEVRTRLRELVELTDDRGRTLVHAAALGANMDCLKLILLAGGNPFRADFRGWTPLHYAVTSCSFATHLSRSIFNDSFEDELSGSSFDRCTYRSNAINEAVTTSLVFLKLGANVNVTDRLGCTVLHLACAFDTTGVLVDHLIQYGANLFMYTSWPPAISLSTPFWIKHECSNAVSRYSPLHIAVNCSNLPAVRVLLDACPEDQLSAYTIGTTSQTTANGITPTPSDRCPNSPSPFLLAAFRGDEQIMKRLLEAWCDSTCDTNTGETHLPGNSLPGQVRDNSGRTALHLAAFQGHLEICRLLLDSAHLTGTSLFTKDSVYQWNALHYAADRGHANVIKLLLDYAKLSSSSTSPAASSVPEIEAFVHEVDDHCRTALMLASQNNHLEVVRLLLQLETDFKHKHATINATDVYDRTAFHRSVANGYGECAELLLQNGADASVHDFRHRHALHMAATGGQVKTLVITLQHLIQLAKDHGDSPGSRSARNLLCPLDQHGFTPLHFAAYCGHADCIQALLNVTCYEKLRGNTYTPIHCASQNGHSDCLKLLLNQYGPNYVTVSDFDGKTPLHIAAQANQLDCLDELLHFVELHSERLRIPPHKEILPNDSKQLLSFASFVIQRDNDGRTALMLAASSGATSCVERLLDVQTRLNTELMNFRDLGDDTVDFFASLSDHFSMRAADTNGRTVLHLACTSQDDAAGLAVLERIEDISVLNQRDRYQRTALHLAIASGLIGLTEALINRGVDLYAVDNEGCSPAFAAAPTTQVATCLSLALAAMFPPIGKTVDENPFLRTSGTLMSTRPDISLSVLNDSPPYGVTVRQPVVQTPSVSSHPTFYSNIDADFF